MKGTLPEAYAADREHGGWRDESHSLGPGTKLPPAVLGGRADALGTVPWCGSAMACVPQEAAGQAPRRRGWEQMRKVGRQVSQMRSVSSEVARGGPNQNLLPPRQRPGLCQAVGDAEAGVRGQAVPEQRACGRPPGPPPGQSVLEGVRVQGQGPQPLPAVSPRSAALGSGRRWPSLWWTLAGAAAEILRR